MNPPWNGSGAKVQAAARLRHANIVTAFDAEQAGALHYLVMEFVEGVTLAEVVAKQGPLPAGEACHYIRQAAEGLQHAHDRGDGAPRHQAPQPDDRAADRDDHGQRHSREDS